MSIFCDNLPSAEKYVYVDEVGKLQLNFESAGITITVPEGGSRLDVHMEPNLDPVQVRNHVYGSGLSAHCYLHGLLPLHGSAVQVGEKAIIFTGDSGAGKSTLATAMVRQGYRLLSDDVCALEFRGRKASFAPPCISKGEASRKRHRRIRFGAGHHIHRVTTWHEGSLRDGAPRPRRRGRHSTHRCHLYATRVAGRVDSSQAGRRARGFPIGWGANSSRSSCRTPGIAWSTFQSPRHLLNTVPVHVLERPRDFSLLDQTAAYIQHHQASVESHTLL
jgi:hypothetical protein